MNWGELEALASITASCGHTLKGTEHSKYKSVHSLDCGHVICTYCVAATKNCAAAGYKSVCPRCHASTVHKNSQPPRAKALVATCEWLVTELKKRKEAEKRASDARFMVNCAQCGEKGDKERVKHWCAEESCEWEEKPICQTCFVDLHFGHARRSPHGLQYGVVHRQPEFTRVDHAAFPDARTLVARGVRGDRAEFTVSGTLLAVSSPFFHQLFYGCEKRMEQRRFEIEAEGRDLAAVIACLYRDWNRCICEHCEKGKEARLDLARRLEISRYLKKHRHDLRGGAEVEQLHLPRPSITFSFPDARILHVREAAFVVSTTILSLKGDFFKKLFHSTPIDNQSEFYLNECDPDTFAALLRGKIRKPRSIDAMRAREVFYKREPSVERVYQHRAKADLPTAVRDACELLWFRDNKYDNPRDNVKRVFRQLKELDRKWMQSEGLRGERKDWISNMDYDYWDRDYARVERRKGVAARDKKDEEKKKREPEIRKMMEKWREEEEKRAEEEKERDRKRRRSEIAESGAKKERVDWIL